LHAIKVLLDRGLLPPFQRIGLQRFGQRADGRYRFCRARRRTLVQWHLVADWQRRGAPDGQQAAAREEPVRQPVIGDNAQERRDLAWAEAAAVAHLATEAVHGHAKRQGDLEHGAPFFDDQDAAEQVAEPGGRRGPFRYHRTQTRLSQAVEIAGPRQCERCGLRLGNRRPVDRAR
jgi:hypothetical protein